VSIDMRGLNRVVAHEHGDMTATIEAGATLRDVNRALGQHGQWLPLDPSFADEATIGGILATNDSGPLRHRYGTPRDLVIGIRVATTEGALSKAGGQVVKNVAGYDLAKLLTGSYGALAAIVSATFKLAPVPKASKTLVFDVDSAAAAARIITTMTTSQIEPIAFEIVARLPRTTHRQAIRVLLRFASLPVVVDAQVSEATHALQGCAATADVLEGDAERGAWRSHADLVWSDGDAVVARASWMPATVETVIATLDECASAARASGAEVSLIGRASVGAGFIRIDGPVDAQVAALERLRSSGSVGNVAVLRASPAVKSRVDAWGSDEGRGRLFKSLKHAFDPQGVLVGQGPL
jgi:glycolate dehydrogenase FAD-binding subunit